MTPREYLKLELMVYAINNDYFGYASECKKRKDGKWFYKIGENTCVNTGVQLATEWDNLFDDDKKNILEDFAREELKVNINLR